jgi:hypothetical protein
MMCIQNLFLEDVRNRKINSWNFRKNKSGFDNDQDINYLIRTIDSIYLKYKICRNIILHLPSNDVYCLEKR